MVFAQKIFRTTLIISFSLSCAACNNNQTQTTAANVITVNKQADTNTLYLNSAIEPIKIINVIAPFDGVITQQAFDYGELLKKNKLLFIINSSQFNDTYQEALANYLKAKKDYSNNLSKMHGTEELKRLGIISDDDYMNYKNQIYDSSLSLAQATRKLQTLLTKTNNPINLANLNTNNAQAISNLLQNDIEQLKIYSPSTGIALLPTKNTSNTDNDTNKPLHLGDQVKAGQILLTVGDISGIILSVKINEIHINAIKSGQKAIITSDAFKDSLQGQVTHVDQQATQASGDSTPSFTVKITVSTITAAQLKDIHIGMSAKVALQISNPAAIKVPISAIIDKNGQAYVKRLDKNSQQFIEIPVVTGTTTLDAVVIQQGLNSGDEVLANAHR